MELSTRHHSISQSILGIGVPAVTTCRVCERVLTDPVSVAAGMGPVCRGKHRDDAGAPARTQLDPFDPSTMDITCWRLPDGTPVFNIDHRHKHHSPTGMEFGYAGSGPADFALNILALFLPVQADASRVDIIRDRAQDEFVPLWDGSKVSADAWDLHQNLKRSFIAPMPESGGTIQGWVIRNWIGHQMRGAA